MSDPCDRLRRARVEAGYSTATAAATAFGFKYVTYSAHENGSRGFGKEEAKRYGKAYRVSPEWLLFGVGKKGTVAIPVVGKVGAGARLNYYDDHSKGNGLEMIDAPQVLA